MTIITRDPVGPIIDGALHEDLDTRGDVTSTALFSPDETATAVIKSKSAGTLSGATLIGPVFSRCDPRITTELLCRDGAPLAPETVICRIAGPVNGILAGERTILNFLQRLSGIATLTARYKAAIAHTNAHLLDTRKTTPQLRFLEKQAVVHGGGCNPRFDLFDMILIKDTHVRRAGGVANALKKAFASRSENENSDLKIEIEVQTPEEFDEAIGFAPDRIMLDNMTPETMRSCVALRSRRAPPVELEASGGITLATIAAVAESGVDFISVGALTHSAPALDIHLIIT